MTSSKNVQDTHISDQLRRLHGALLDIVAAMNRPRRDEDLIAAAGIPLDGALFPLLVLIERFGPIGVVDLADRVGRDHSTVSRQVARLEESGLIARRPGVTDRRVRDAVATQEGRATCRRIDVARERLMRGALADWDGKELDALVRLMGRFAAAFGAALPQDRAGSLDAPTGRLGDAGLPTAGKNGRGDGGA
ncbi:MarR family transcriptional regulator [Ancylobacter sp. 6x-1]|uniref:MarR family transcriptional regulator n=1 Tax=Ancylobacter crimeensis TaxID=2579147 RepID=A0ABT0D6B0_9HYPH|nr:MarR family transcriptional regulator [Ancylobacter crimeensis]MCK0195474.1 MarR family transcriptional regulator [Ancylobacter crimeensis]